MRKLSRKALSIVMSIVLVVGLCPGLAYADEGGEDAVPESDALVVAKSTDLSDLSAQADAELSVQATADGSLDAFVSVVKAEPNGTPAGGMKNKYNNYRSCAYCAYFVMWCARQAGVTSDVIPDAPVCQNMVNFYKSKGLWKPYTYKAKAGDLIFYSSSSTNGKAEHVGVVISVSGNKLTTKEGNSNYGKVVTFNGTGGNALRTAGSSGFPGWYIIGYATPSYRTPRSTVATPTINTPASVLGGVDVTMSDSTSGATIRYSANGGGYANYSKAIRDTSANVTYTAYATKSGWNDSGSTSRKVSLSQTATPTLEKVDMPNGGTIVLDAPGNGETIYYTTDGSNPSFNVSSQQATGTKYTGSFTLTQNATVKAIAVRSGERVSELMTQDVEVVPPAAPATVVVLNGTMPASKIAVDDAVTVRWAEDKSASSYIATLYDEGGNVVETSTVKAAQAVFTPSKAGKYSVGVKAVNSVGASAESERDNFEAMAPCLVNFVDKITDDEGNTTTKVLDKQLVRYGYSAENPAVPVKRGYTFAGWDKDTPLTHVTQDGYEIIATWQVKTYTVRWYKDDGKTLLKSESVEYQKTATPPTPPTPEAGYVFSGWAVTEAAESDSERDYESVDSNMSLKAVYAWGDQELPVVVSITSAKRNERVYTVDVNVKNNPTTATTAILRVSLKTASGKLVQSARETISLPAAGAETNHTVTLKYEDGGYIATKAEVEVVGFSGDNRTGGAYSKAVTATVVNESSYALATSASEWTTVKPAESNDYVIESETQYRYQDKQTTTSTATSLEGWTRDNDATSVKYGEWETKPSTTAKPTESDVLRLVGDPVTMYKYYRYCNYYNGGWQQDSVPYGSGSLYHEVLLYSPMAACPNKFSDKGGKAWDLHGPYGSCNQKKEGQSYWWTLSITTAYQYQTRTKSIIYRRLRQDVWVDRPHSKPPSSLGAVAAGRNI